MRNLHHLTQALQENCRQQQEQILSEKKKTTSLSSKSAFSHLSQRSKRDSLDCDEDIQQRLAQLNESIRLDELGQSNLQEACKKQLDAKDSIEELELRMEKYATRSKSPGQWCRRFKYNGNNHC